MFAINLTRRDVVRTAAAISAALVMPRVRVAHAAAFARAADGTRLHYETDGNGPPVVFLHEASRWCRSFDLQVAALKARFQCVMYNARGYPPSDVPASVEAYSQNLQTSDVGSVLDALGLTEVHLVGVSMGSAAALQFTLGNSSRVRSLTLCSIGAGSDLKPGEYAVRMDQFAAKVEASDQKMLAELLGSTPDRKRLSEKNPIEFGKFIDQTASLSPAGLANTLRGVGRRPPIYAYKERLAAMTTPTLVVVGEHDPPCMSPSRFLAQTIPAARLEVIAGSGHSVNVEEPEKINRLVAEFVVAAESKRSAR